MIGDDAGYQNIKVRATSPDIKKNTKKKEKEIVDSSIIFENFIEDEINRKSYGEKKEDKKIRTKNHSSLCVIIS